MKPLRIVLIKPSKYERDGSVARFRQGYMANATLYHISSLTPREVEGVPTAVHTVDEYVRQDIDYLDLLEPDPDCTTLLAVVGVQSHQFHRALDLAAYALSRGTRHCVIGGPHPMTCDTAALQGRGVSFALAEAELVWPQILRDALGGVLKPVYGADRRWADKLPPLVIDPPNPEDLARYGVPLLGLYPSRGCPYQCRFCSIIKISGRAMRTSGFESTLESLRRAKRAGVRVVNFVSDNFNKYSEVHDLLQGMIDERLEIPFYCQCDTQIVKQPDLIELMGQAHCYEIFLGVESFNRTTLKAAGKHHNNPDQYEEIVRLCRDAGIRSHFSNIIGFLEDDESDVVRHLDVLKKLNPDKTSFYIFTPVPGTEQYEEYREKGWITEKNLDRFDASTSVWAHPNLSAKKLEDLLYHCYTSFYGHAIRSHRPQGDDLRFAVFCRYMASHRRHPMAGGIDPVVVDTVSAYLPLRRATFGLEITPLPDSLPLSDHDEALNRLANWRLSKHAIAPEHGA
jgi:hypothetical protein